MYHAIPISIPTTRLEDLADGEARSCVHRRIDDDLPATPVMTASAGSRSFWANIVMEIMLFSNFSNVSSAQLDDSMAAESTARRWERKLRLVDC
jgi:hypothetical protein